MDLPEDWDPSSHLTINLQRTATLSKEELQTLYKTGHLSSEQGWHHVGEVSYWDKSYLYLNSEMENLRYLLEVMNSPKPVFSFRKQITKENGCFPEGSITFHYYIPFIIISLSVRLITGMLLCAQE
jgi:hypothetical protein